MARVHDMFASRAKRGASAALRRWLAGPVLGVFVALIAAGPAAAGPASAWQPLGSAPNGAIGLTATAADPAAVVVHGGERYIAVIEQRQQLVVYRQFRAGYGTVRDWLPAGGPLSRADTGAMGPTLLSTRDGELYAAWIEERGRSFVMVARMQRDRQRVRWEPVGAPIPTLLSNWDRPRLIELGGTLRVVLRDERRQGRVARLTEAGWQLAPTPVTLPGVLGDVLAYRGSLYIVSQIGDGFSTLDEMTARVTPTPEGDVRVQNLGEVPGTDVGRGWTRLAAGPPSLNGGRPIMVFFDRGALALHQLAADGRSFAPITRIEPPAGERFDGAAVLATLDDEILVGARGDGADATRFHIYRLAARPALQVIGTADPPVDPSGVVELTADNDANALVLTYQRLDRDRERRAAALALQL